MTVTLQDILERIHLAKEKGETTLFLDSSTYPVYGTMKELEAKGYKISREFSIAGYLLAETISW